MEEKKLTGYPSIDKPWLKYYSEGAVNAPLSACTIFEYLWQNNREHLEDTALINFDKRISYGDMFEYMAHGGGFCHGWRQAWRHRDASVGEHT